jgi:hypothetical protein
MRILSFLMMCVFLLTSCKFGSSDGVKKPYENLINHLEETFKNSQNSEDEFRLNKAIKIKELSEKQIKTINKVPTFVNRYYLFETEQNTTDRLNDMYTIVDKHIKSCEEKSLELQKEIHSLGKHQYIISKDAQRNQSAIHHINTEVAILFGLQYMKRMYETCAGLSFHYINEFAHEKYNKYPLIFKLRENLLRNFMGLSAMLKVIARDSLTISERLVEAKNNDVMSTEQDQLISQLAQDMTLSTQKLQEVTTDVLENGLDEAMKEAYHEMQDKTDLIFKDKSILFDPAHPDHPIVHVLVIVSNLTWGSIQTSIGLGIILTHAIIVTPMSWLLDAIWPYHFMKLNGPKLKISRNKMQIYADVCGFPAIPSKMSMGLFELDFCAGYSFASAHEGGHAKQSALLGPFYLPAAILSYAINLGHGGFIEHWADDWYVRN